MKEQKIGIARYDTFAASEEELEYFMSDDLNASIEALNEESVEFFDRDDNMVFLGKTLEKCGGDPKKFHEELKSMGIDIEDDVQRVRLFDTEVYDNEWDMCKYDIDQWIEENAGPYIILGTNMGWRALDGWAVIDTDDGEEFFHRINPDTGDLTFNMWSDDDPATAYASVSHHDAPMGEGREIWTMTDLIKALSYKQIREIVASWQADMTYYDIKPSSYKRQYLEAFMKDELYESMGDDFMLSILEKYKGE